MGSAFWQLVDVVNVAIYVVDIYILKEQANLESSGSLVYSVLGVVLEVICWH